jgi:hypothetical protein
MINDLSQEQLNDLHHVYQALKECWASYIQGYESATETLRLFKDTLNDFELIPIRKIIAVDQGLTSGAIIRMTDHLEEESKREKTRKDRLAYVTPNWNSTQKTIQAVKEKKTPTLKHSR